MTKVGAVLVINGEVFDFSQMEEGATLPRIAIMSKHFNDDVHLINGELVVTLIMPIPTNYSPEQAFPLPLRNVPDGPVMLPQPLWLPEPPHENAL